MANYQLLVLDLDGTLTNSEKKITPHTLETLMRLQRRGVQLVLASGRPTYGITPLADQLRMKEYDGYILSYNGGEIINCRTGMMLYKNLLPDKVLPQLYDCARRHGQPILTYDGPCIVTENPDNRFVREEAFINKMKVRRVENFLSETPRPLPKCLIVDHPDGLMETEAELNTSMQGRISVYRSAPYFLELVPQGIDKAQSLAALLKELGLEREQMVAMGDGYNDLSMIRFAGLGIAMGNAVEPVKKVADYVTLTNEEDGVAAAVEKWFF